MDSHLTRNSVTSSLKGFYWLDDPLANAAFRGSPDDFEMGQLTRGMPVTGTAARVRQLRGSTLRDFIWVEPHPVINDRVVELLSSHGLTGWTTYPVEILDRRGEIVRGYHGLAVTGRCQSIRIGKKYSNVVYKDYPGGTFPNYKGLYFSKDSWDGSDFLVAADGQGGWILVTERVRQLFRKNRVTNCRLTPIEDVEIAVSDQPDLLPSRT